MTLSDLKIYYRTVIKVLAGGPPVGTPGANRAAGVLSALDKVAEFANEGLAAKQGAVVKTTRAFVPGATDTLSRTHLDAYCLLTTQQDCVIDLPVPTLADVGRIIVVNHYANDGIVSWQVSLAGSSTNPTPPPAEKLAASPQGYVTMFEVVAHERGTPYDDVVATWVVLANSIRDATGSEFQHGTYTVQAGDVTNPASAITIPVASALVFGMVGVAKPNVSGQDILTPGSDYTSQAGQLVIAASLNPPLAAGDKVHYSYLAGTVSAPPATLIAFVGAPGQPQDVVQGSFYYIAGQGLYQRTGANASVTILDTTNTASWKVVLEQAQEQEILPTGPKRLQVVGLFSANQIHAQDVAMSGDPRSNYFGSSFRDFNSGYTYTCFPRPDMPDSNGYATAWWVKA